MADNPDHPLLGHSAYGAGLGSALVSPLTYTEEPVKKKATSKPTTVDTWSLPSVWWIVLIAAIIGTVIGLAVYGASTIRSLQHDSISDPVSFADLQLFNNTQQAQWVDLRNDNMFVQSQLNQLGQMLLSSQTQILALQQANITAQAQILALQQANVTAQAQIASLQQSRAAQQSEIATLQQQASGNTSAFADVLSTIQQELGQAVQNISSLANELLSMSLLDLTDDQGNLNATALVLRLRIVLLEQKVATVVATLGNFQQNVTSDMNLVQSEIGALNSTDQQLLNQANTLASTVASQGSDIGLLNTVTVDLGDTVSSLTVRVATLEGTVLALNASRLDADGAQDAIIFILRTNVTSLFGQTASLLATDVAQNADLVTLHTDDIALFASDSSLSDRITVLENTQSAIQQSFNMLNTLDVAQIAALLIDTASIQVAAGNVTTLLNVLRQDVVLFQIANNTNCSSVAFDAFYADWQATSYQFGNVTVYFNAFVQQINIHNVTLTTLAAVTNELLSVGFGLLTNYNMMLGDLTNIEFGCNALNTTFAVQALGLTRNLNSTRDAVHILVLQLGSFGVSDPQVAFELAQTIVEVATIDARVTTVETQLTNLTTTVTQLDQLVNNQNAVFNLQLLNILSLLTSAQSELDGLNSEIITLQLAFGYFVGNQTNFNSAVLAQFQQVFANLSSANVIAQILQTELHSLEANITYQNGISQAQLNQVNVTLTNLILQVNTQFALVQGSITGLQAELLAHQIQDDALFGLINQTIATMSNTTANSILSLVTSMTAVQTTVAILVGQVDILNNEVTSLQVYQNTSSTNITSIWVYLAADNAAENLQFSAITNNFTTIVNNQGVQSGQIAGLVAATKQATLAITSAQLLALSTTPLTLIPAPPAGYYIWPTYYTIQYHFGTTAYTSPAHTNDAYFSYGSPPATASNEIAVYDWASATTGIIEATQSVTFIGICGEGLTPYTIINGAPVIFSAPNALTLGNGNLTIVVDYTIVPLP